METIYLAGSINGCSYEEATESRERLEHYLTLEGFRTLSPMRGKSGLKGEDCILDFNTDYRPIDILKRDRIDIHESHIVLADLNGLGKKPMIGTLMELGIALQLGKKVFIYNIPSDLAKHPFLHQFTNLDNHWDDMYNFLSDHLEDQGKEPLIDCIEQVISYGVKYFTTY